MYRLTSFMEMEEDKDIPVILGRPFLKTARTIIDVENGTLTLRIGDEKVQFNINRAIKYPSESAVPETCYAMDVVDQSVEDLTHGPRAYQHTVHAPQPEKLTIAHKADTGQAHGPDLLRTDRVPTQTQLPPPEPDPHPTNLKFLEDFKALQMVIRNTILKATQTMIGDLIEKFSGTDQVTFRTSRTNIIPHEPFQYHPGRAYNHTDRSDMHTARAPLKWMLLPDPPDLHSANR